MSLNENLHRGQKVKLLDGTTGFIKGPITNFGFQMWEIQLDNGKIQTEARYRFNVVEEPPTKPPELDAYEELLPLFQNEINNKDYDHLTSPHPHYHRLHHHQSNPPVPPNPLSSTTGQENLHQLIMTLLKNL